LISIIIPAYNTEKFIEDTICSILDQTYSNFEIILIDDGSSICLSDVIGEKFDDERIVVITNESNVGVSASRNIGIHNAKYRYLAFIDSDDIWLEDKLEIQLKQMQEFGLSISHTSYTFIDSEGDNIKGYSAAQNISTVLEYLKCTNIGLSTVMLDSKKLKNIFFPENEQREDFFLWIKLLELGEEFHAIDLPLSKYRIHPGQASENKVSMAIYMAKFYFSYKNISFLARVRCFFCYLVNGIYKRL
jgi:teichuronic acid biosynthesis glycosyltransferase TuaG